MTTGAILANLALGTSAATAIFALADATLLAPLPYRAPDRLVEVVPKFRVMDVGSLPLSEPELFDIEERSDFLEWMGGFHSMEWTLSGSGEPRRLRGMFVTRELFPGLGTPPARGRALAAEDFEPGAPHVVLLSHSLWRERFGANPAILGRPIELGESSATVIGVMPEGFRMPHELASPTPTEAWRPRPLDARRPGPRAIRYLTAIGGLRPGISLPAAGSEAEAIAASLAREYPQDYPEQLGFELRYLPLEEEIFGGSKHFLALFGCAAFLVLSIACFNVTALLTAHGEDRAAELATRAAIGATRRHLLQLLTIENLILFGAGGLLGLALAGPLLQVLTVVAPEGLPRLHQASLGWRSVVFGLVLSGVVLVPFGILPAWSVSRQGARWSLAGASSRDAVPPFHRRLSTALVVVQIALAFAVITGAMLLATSWGRMQEVELGVAPANGETLEIALPPARYADTAAVESGLEELRQALESIPGVIAAGTVDRLPMTGEVQLLSFTPEAYVPPPGGRGPLAVISVVGGNLLDALGIRLVEAESAEAGRLLGPKPVRRRSVVVNRTLADRYFPGRSALGKRLKLGSEKEWLEIVGVVEDVHMEGPAVAPEPQVLVAAEQALMKEGGPDPRVTRPFLVVRTDGTVGTNTLRKRVWEVDPTIPINESRPLGQIVAAATARPRLGAFFLTLMAGVASLLAATGVYALNHRSVLRRRREVGVRIALGATRRSVFTQVLGRSLATGAVGLLLGLLLVVGGRRSLESFLFGVAATDPWLLGLSLLLVTLVMVGAAALPARRAAYSSPTAAIRED